MSSARKLFNRGSLHHTDRHTEQTQPLSLSFPQQKHAACKIIAACGGSCNNFLVSASGKYTVSKCSVNAAAVKASNLCVIPLDKCETCCRILDGSGLRSTTSMSTPSFCAAKAVFMDAMY
mmetsp:Transcript_25001/g.40031  ORF Transcript_25001/g.40031 Transcript_25001/m.40031 type:complete len:120 (+) Transcript_25001:138-497(+)